jgi:hypothetical protein
MIKSMIIVIATLLLTWVGFATICYLLAEPEITFKSAMKNETVLMCMFAFGYSPAVIVMISEVNKSNF